MILFYRICRLLPVDGHLGTEVMKLIKLFIHIQDNYDLRHIFITNIEISGHKVHQIGHSEGNIR